MNKIALKNEHKITLDKMVSCKEQKDNEKILLVINVGCSAHSTLSENITGISPVWHNIVIIIISAHLFLPALEGLHML